MKSLVIKYFLTFIVDKNVKYNIYRTTSLIYLFFFLFEWRSPLDEKCRWHSRYFIRAHSEDKDQAILLDEQI